MNNTTHDPDRDINQVLETEKKRDRFVRRICIGAWSVTIAVVLIYGAIVSLEVIRLLQWADAGMVTEGMAMGALIPLLVVVGVISLLIAVLGTVGVFLRLRTASLTEIQLRLAALEQVITGE